MKQNILMITRIVIIILYLIINYTNTAIICLWVHVKYKIGEGRVYMHFFFPGTKLLYPDYAGFWTFNQTEYVLIAIFWCLYISLLIRWTDDRSQLIWWKWGEEVTAPHPLEVMEGEEGAQAPEGVAMVVVAEMIRLLY